MVRSIKLNNPAFIHHGNFVEIQNIVQLVNNANNCFALELAVDNALNVFLRFGINA